MLISQMLQVNVDTRFTAEEVLSHPWVTVRAQTEYTYKYFTHIQATREELSFITLVFGTLKQKFYGCFMKTLCSSKQLELILTTVTKTQDHFLETSTFKLLIKPYKNIK